MKQFGLILAFLFAAAGATPAQDWQSINFPSSEAVTGILMFSPDSGYIVTGDGNFIKTYDRGKTWTRADALSAVRLESLYFLDKKTGWVCGHKGRIFFTADGGHNWVDQSWKDTMAIFLEIQMINKDTGVVVGMRPDSVNTLASIALRTTDGGKTWKQLETMGMAYSEILYDKPGRKLYLMSLGKMHFSSDGGNKWKSLFTIEGSPARTFSIFDNTGIMAGPKGVCAYSADSGKTWYKNARGQTEHFVSSVLVDSKRGYIAGLDGLMLATKDGGRTWEPEKLPETFLVLDMYVNGKNVYAVGTEGVILCKQLQQ